MNMMIDGDVVLELENLNDVLTCISIGVNEVNIKNEILSNEEKFEIEKQKQIERLMLEELDHDCRENDSGVSIRDNYKIKELFHESIVEFFTEFEEKLRFRNDIEIQCEYAGKGDNGKLFSVKSKITQERLEFYFDMSICDSEGSESILDFYCSNKDFEVSRTVLGRTECRKCKSKKDNRK